MRCDLSVPYEAMVWLGQEEESDLQVLRKLLRPGDTFVDCGANIGLWTVTAAMAVRDEGHVCAFEPNEIPRQRLQETVAGCAMKNVAVFPFAVGGRDGEAFLEADPQHNRSHLSAAPGPASVRVPVVRLDAILGDRAVDGCKIDVEGHELEVLLGMEDLIGRSRPWLCVEFNTIIDGNRRLGNWKVDPFLRARGYAPFLGVALLEGSRHEPVDEGREITGYVNLFYLPVEGLDSRFAALRGGTDDTTDPA